MGESHSRRVLVTGGAGYIGSHISLSLSQHGFEPVIFDSLYSGHRWAAIDAEFIEGNIADTEKLRGILENKEFSAVIHCAAHIWVGESMEDPAKYYWNNTANSIGLFNLCQQCGVDSVVMSSTAAVYGIPGKPLIDEDTPLDPINPYGASKFMAERVLMDIGKAHGMTFGILRYFNVAGADPSGQLGEATPDNSHLIKVACETAFGRRSGMYINGTDYPTRDGTCVRDYVHVSDLALAHVLTLERLLDRGESQILNCGYGRGFSVKEVLTAVREITKIDFPIEIRERRPGDPPELVADTKRLRQTLDWQPQFDDLEAIVASAWAWEQRLDAMQNP